MDPTASKDEAKAGSDKTHQECPPEYQTDDSGDDPQPRCMYFRVGM